MPRILTLSLNCPAIFAASIEKIQGYLISVWHSMARLLPRAAGSLVALIAFGQRSTQAFSPFYYRSAVFPSSATATAITSTTITTTTVVQMATKRVLVPIGEGSEEIETTCITDTLTRFGAEVTVASVMQGQLLCKMSRGIKVRPSVW
jgi:hypothetical protein